MLKPPVKRNVIYYFIADTCLFTSVYLTIFSMVWLTYKLTDSSADLGMVSFVLNFPILLFSIFGGVIADNYDRKKTVFRFNAIFVIIASLVLITFATNLLSYPLVLFFSLLLGGTYSIYYPSVIAMVQDMVADKDEFPRVMGAAATNANTGKLLASSSFGFLISLFTVAGAFATALFFNIVSLISIASIKYTSPVIKKKKESVVEQIKTGLGYVIINKPLLAIVVMTSIITLPFLFVIFQMPLIDKTFLNGTSTDMGILYIGGAIGGITSGAYLGRRKSTKNLLWFLIVCALISGASLIGLSLSRELWLSFICVIGVDFAFIAASGMSNTLLQLLSRKDVCGRVLGVNTMMMWGFSSMVMLLMGFLAKSMGIEKVMIGIGTLLILSFIVYVLSIKFQRPLLARLYSAQNIPPEKQPI